MKIIFDNIEKYQIILNNVLLIATIDEKFFGIIWYFLKFCQNIQKYFRAKQNNSIFAKNIRYFFDQIPHNIKKYQIFLENSVEVLQNYRIFLDPKKILFWLMLLQKSQKFSIFSDICVNFLRLSGNWHRIFFNIFSKYWIFFTIVPIYIKIGFEISYNSK